MSKRIVLAALLIATIIGTGQLGGSVNSTSTPVFNHIIIVMFENRPINGTFGVVNQPGGPYPQNAPYITSLANSYGLAKAYYDVQQGGCGSITDYIGITNANVTGIDAACNSGLHCNSTTSGACTQTGKNIADRLEAAGLTWKSYHENMTSPCLNSGSADHIYDPGHNPWLYYSDIFSNTTNPTRCTDHVVPAAAGGNMDGALLNDLNSASPSNYIWLTPNDCNGMYIYCPGGVNSGTSCTSTDPSIQATCVSEGDAFVKKLYPQIANTQAWKSGSTVLFLTWDEPTFASSTQCPGYNPSVPSPSEPCQIPGIWIGPPVKPGHTSNTFYTHFSVLTTLEKLWGLAPLTSRDASAMPMSEFFSTAPPDFAISANPASVTATTGATGSSTITVSPVNFFSGTVTLSVKASPTSLTCSLSPTTVTGGSGSSSLKCSSSVPGSYVANVTGTSGGLSHSVLVSYQIKAPVSVIPAYVVVIVLENQPLSAVYGSGCNDIDCGYITQLANTYGIALSYSGVAHQSLPNYLTLTSGGNYSNNPSSCSISPNSFNCDPPPSLSQVAGAGTNIVDALTQSGRTWRAYMEDYNAIPGCYLSDTTGGRRFNTTDTTTEYHSTHNPFVYYPDISNNLTRCMNIVNANGLSTGYFAGPTGGLPTALLSDLNGQSPPNLMWLTPNACNDGHDFSPVSAECPLADPVLEQNNYLKALVPMILNSATFLNKPSALYITWDEGKACSNLGQTFPTCNDPVATIWAGPTVRQGYQSTITYSHYNFIPTLENFWNLPPLPIPSSINALPMLDFFAPTSIVSVIKGPNNGILWDAFLSGSWRGWQSLPGGTASAVALCPSSAGRIDVLIRGTDNSIYHSSFTNAVWSGSWDGPGGGTLDQPSCAVLNGNLYVAIRGTDSAIWIASMSLLTGQWSSWTGLGGGTLSTPVLVATPSLNRLDVVIRGTDNGIYHMAMTGGSWSRVWDSPGGGTLYKPAVVSDGSALQVVVTGTDQGVWYTSFNLNSASWARWTVLSGTASASPSLAIDSNGTLNLVLTGTDSSVWHKSKPSGGSWSAWDSAGGITFASPAVVQLGTEVVVVVIGTDNAIWFNQFGSVWQGWKTLGGTAFSPPSLSTTG